MNQFGSESCEVKKIKFLCAPAVKTPPGLPIVNETDHLVGYQIKCPDFAISVHTNNQFGPEVVTTKKPKTLYVPAFKAACCPVCGDGVCEGDENECNCPADCTSGCGGFCLQQIPVCGPPMSVCEPCNAPGESHESCPGDCPLNCVNCPP